MIEPLDILENFDKITQAIALRPESEIKNKTDNKKVVNFLKIFGLLSLAAVFIIFILEKNEENKKKSLMKKKINDL